MDIDVKSIQVWSQSVIEVSVAFVKEHHTILLGVLSFLFPLYLFFPSLFVFFVFAVPIFTFIAFAFRLIFRIHQENLRLAKGENYNHVNISRKITPNTGSRNLDRRGRSYAHAQSVRRRNSKIYENQVYFKEDLDSTTDNHASVDKVVLVEETPKEIREVEDVSKTDRSIAFGDGSGLRPASYSSEGLLVEGENSDDGEDDEEEAPGSGNDAVEWTEDDQKNLMELGFSEMERNKRLESLIAKRKAKKLLSLQVRRSLMNIGRGNPSGEMGSFMLPNMGVFPKTKDEALMSPTPGSAPSVLVPLHNPFDIPYDPQEEKPNLTGGFQEELVEPHHKDPVFCRHQSFNWGTTYPAPWKLDQNQAGTSHGPNLPIKSQAREIPEFAKLKKHLGKEELNEQMETKTSQQSETKPCTNSSGDSTQQHKVSEKALNLKEVHSADGTIKVEDVKMLDTFDIQETGSSSSSEIIAPFTTANKDEILKSLSFSMRKNIPLPEIVSNARREELFYNESPSPFNYTGMYGRHTPSCSIASDMYVEVSEASSQISNFSLDEGSPKFDDTGDLDVENEGISENLEDWVAPPLLKKVEENESRLREVCEVSEQDIIKVGFSKINQDIEEPIIPKSNQSCSSDSSNKVHKEVQPPKEPSNSVESTTKNAKTTEDMNDKVELVNDDQGIISFIQHTNGENSESTNQGTSQGTSAPTLNKDSKPVDVNAGTHTQQENTNSKVKTQSEPAKATNELSFTGKNIHVRETIDQQGPSKASSRRFAKSVRKVKSFRRPETPLSPCTTPNSSKFYLMANLSFDDAYVEPQQSNVETEGNNNVSKDSQAVKNHAGDSVGSQESSSPAGRSIVKDKTSHEGNDVPIDESSGHGLVQTSITGGDVGLQTPVVNETINEAEEVGKLESSKDKEGHPQIHSTINNLEPVGVIKSDSGSVEATRKSEAGHIGKDLILPGDSYTQVTEVVGENGTSKASSSTSPGPSVKESSIPLGCSTGENNASMNDTGQQISKKENEKTETVKEVEEIGKLEKSKDVENHSKLYITIENSEPTGVVKNDSGNVGKVKRKSEPENAGQGSGLLRNNRLRIRELIARNSFKKGSSPSSPGPGLKEPNSPFANSTSEDKTSFNMKDKAISESMGGAHVHSTVLGDEGSQTSAKEDEKTEIIKGAEEIGKLEKSKEFESHSKPIRVLKSDSGNVVEVKSKSEPELVGKGLNSTGSNINVKEAVPGNGLSKASSSTSPRPINGTEETGTLEKSKDIETQSKLHNTVVSSEPIGVLKGDSGNVGDAKSESEPDNLGKGLKSSGGVDINGEEAVPENGLSKASSSTSPKTMKGDEEIGKLEKIKDIESPSKLHNTIDNSEPIGVTKSDHGNLGEVKSNSDSKHVDKGLDSIGDSTIKVSDSGHENGLRKASSSTSPEPIKGAEEIGKLEKPTDIESDSKLQNTVVNSELTGVMKTDSGNVGVAKSKSEPEIVGKGLSLIGDSNVKGKESVPENGLSDSSKSPEPATKEPPVPLGSATTDKTSHNINDSSKPVEVPKSDSGNAGELGSNIHDRKVLAENGTDNASVSTSPEPVTKESSFPLGSSSVKGKVSTSVNDRAINEASGSEVVQKSIIQDDKSSQISVKENEKTETIKGGEKIEKLEGPKDVEGQLNHKIDKSKPIDDIKSDSPNVEEVKSKSEPDHVGKKFTEGVDENGKTKPSTSASSGNVTKGSPSPPLGLSIGEEKTSKGMKDGGINEGSEGRPEETSITQTEKGSPIPTKEGDQTETIKGVEEIGKLEKSKDVEVNSKLHNTIDNSGPSTVIKTDSGNIEEAKRNSGLANVDKGLGSAGDSNIHVGEVVVENNSTKAISPEPATKEPSILLEKPEKLVSSVDSMNAPYTSISSNKGQNNQVGADSNLAKPIEPCMSSGNEINPILVKPEVVVEQVNVSPGPSTMTNSTQIDSVQKEAQNEKTRAGDSVGIKESSVPPSLSTGKENINDKAINESSGSELVQTSAAEGFRTNTSQI